MRQPGEADLVWFPIYAAEMLSDEDWQQWTLSERGAWITLIAMAWREGSIPADTARLAKILRVTVSEFERDWNTIGKKFEATKDPQRLTSPRLERERERALILHQHRILAGQKGAERRWGNRDVSRKKRVKSKA